MSARQFDSRNERESEVVRLAERDREQGSSARGKGREREGEVVRLAE